MKTKSVLSSIVTEEHAKQHEQELDQIERVKADEARKQREQAKKAKLRREMQGNQVECLEMNTSQRRKKRSAAQNTTAVKKPGANSNTNKGRPKKQPKLSFTFEDDEEDQE